MSDDEDEQLLNEAAQPVDTKAEGSFLQKSVVEPLAEFVRDGSRFLNNCERPDKTEYTKIVYHIGMAFLMMGVTAFVVKIVHIPITNILL